ncbi:hypothetical protein [Modicisalibacter tunisiensis]|nr:hypothetical protein [Modicisalibacter tunisiensis]
MTVDRDEEDRKGDDGTTRMAGLPARRGVPVDVATGEALRISQ